MDIRIVSVDPAPAPGLVASVDVSINNVAVTCIVRADRRGKLVVNLPTVKIGDTWHRGIRLPQDHFMKLVKMVLREVSDVVEPA